MAPAAVRRRWAVRAVLALLALLAVCVAVWWGARDRPLSEGERHLVGAWTYRWDGAARDLGLEYEFLPDRTCRIRNYHPDTGQLVGEATATWRLSGDTLTVRHPDAKTRTLSRLLPAQRAVEEVSVLTADGPDHFRYRGRSTAGRPPPAP